MNKHLIKTIQRRVKMIKKHTPKLNLPNIIIKHIEANKKEYIIVSLIFIVGIFLGVMFINSAKATQQEEITTYINNYINHAKEQGAIHTSETLKSSIKSNIILAIALWFAGTTLIGIPAVIGIILFRGFCLGYTISACTYAMGAGKAAVFVTIAIMLQNILLIPATIALGVSGIKLYKSIIKDKRKENIKVAILRHTAFSTIMLAILILAAIVKNNISGGLLQNLIKYF